MPDLYHVWIQSIQGKCLSCQVTELYGEGYHLVCSRTLALGFLWDTVDWCWWMRCAAGGELLERDEAEAAAHSTPLGRELGGRDFYADDAGIRESAEQFVSCVGVVDRCDCEYRYVGNETPEIVPQATYHIAVSDPRLLEHLSPGMEWGSRVWDRDWNCVCDSAWRTSAVLALARSINAVLAFDRMPILADALEDARCDSADLIGHLRDPNATHVRGCWALNLILGKE